MAKITSSTVARVLPPPLPRLIAGGDLSNNIVAAHTNARRTVMLVFGLFDDTCSPPVLTLAGDVAVACVSLLTSQ